MVLGDDENQSGGDLKLYVAMQLEKAAQEANDELIARLAACGADVNSVVCEQKYTPAFMAAQKGHTSTLVLLAELGADLDLQNAHGVTPVFVAAQEGKTEAVRLLCALGADTSLRNSHGFTPLHMVAHKGNVECARCLLADGCADPSAVNDSGVTPVFIAAAQGSDAVLRLLVEGHGVDTEVVDANGATPLFMAAYKGHESTVRMLSELGASMAATSSAGRTTLSIARRSGHSSVVSLVEEVHAWQALSEAGKTKGLRCSLLLHHHAANQGVGQAKRAAVGLASGGEGEKGGAGEGGGGGGGGESVGFVRGLDHVKQGSPSYGVGGCGHGVPAFAQWVPLLPAPARQSLTDWTRSLLNDSAGCHLALFGARVQDFCGGREGSGGVGDGALGSSGKEGASPLPSPSLSTSMSSPLPASSPRAAADCPRGGLCLEDVVHGGLAPLRRLISSYLVLPHAPTRRRIRALHQYLLAVASDEDASKNTEGVTGGGGLQSRCLPSTPPLPALPPLRAPDTCLSSPPLAMPKTTTTVKECGGSGGGGGGGGGGGVFREVGGDHRRGSEEEEEEEKEARRRGARGGAEEERGEEGEAEEEEDRAGRPASASVSAALSTALSSERLLRANEAQALMELMVSVEGAQRRVELLGQQLAAQRRLRRLRDQLDGAQLAEASARAELRALRAHEGKLQSAVSATEAMAAALEEAKEAAAAAAAAAAKQTTTANMPVSTILVVGSPGETPPPTTVVGVGAGAMPVAEELNTVVLSDVEQQSSLSSVETATAEEGAGPSGN